MAERVYLTVGEVLEIHHQQIDNYGGARGLRDKGLLESAVFRPQIGYYNTIAEAAAALMESLANNHPFLDGNGCATYKWKSRRPAFLPVVFKFAIQMAAAESQDGVGSSNGPEHS
jgi:Fic/DOC family